MIHFSLQIFSQGFAFFNILQVFVIAVLPLVKILLRFNFQAKQNFVGHPMARSI